VHGVFCDKKGDKKDDEDQIRKKKGNVTQMECSSNKDSNSSITLDWHSKCGRLTADQCIGKTADVAQVKIKLSHMEHTLCLYEENHPLGYLTPTEKAVLQRKLQLTYI